MTTVTQRALVGDGHVELDADLATRTERAVALIRDFAPQDRPYYLCFSGGKDSIVCRHLLDMAGVDYTAHYNVSTLDPPELIYYLREYHPDVQWVRATSKCLPAYMIDKLWPPMRQQRWCCEIYKEKGGDGEFMVLGIRRAESVGRRNRRLIELCPSRQARKLHPILHWSDEDVWAFIRKHDLPYCCLYDEGFRRLGCIGCPMAGAKQVRTQFARWPGYERLWRRWFGRLLEHRAAKGLDTTFLDADEFFQWWVSGQKPNADDDQTCLAFDN
ncbi:MAG: phosphoadenosine phosphosulfate reductase family protein [Verrucomicrobiota bacterium]